MKDCFNDVLEFHKKFNAKIGTRPKTPPINIIMLRENLIEEEYNELITALDTNNLMDIADSCVDLIYVVIGTAISYGFDLTPVWEEVQKCNMKKTNLKRNDGKVLKSKNWIPPNITLVSFGK